MHEFVHLDRKKIKNILMTQDLKRWWVAEYAGIHKTTLRRWLNGSIDRVRKDRVSSLALLLNVEPHQIQKIRRVAIDQNTPGQKTSKR